MWWIRVKARTVVRVDDVAILLYSSAVIVVAITICSSRKLAGAVAMACDVAQNGSGSGGAVVYLCRYDRWRWCGFAQ